MTRAAIAFFGLGALGAVLAARLVAAGHRLAAFDPQPAALAAHHAACGPGLANAAACTVWISCVTDEAAAEALYFGVGGLIERLPGGALAIDHTTTGPGFARRLGAALAARALGFVDCPLSGGLGGARAGKLLALQGGVMADCNRAAAVLAAYCSRITRLGAAGSGQTAKLANQLAIAGTLRGLHEAARLARAGGLDVGTLLEALGAGSAHSAQMDQHAGALAEGERAFGARFGWIAKDLQLARAELRAVGADVGMAGWLLERIAAAEAG